MNFTIVTAFSANKSGLLIMYTMQCLTLKDKVVLIPQLCSVIKAAESQFPRNSLPTPNILGQNMTAHREAE